MESDEFAGMLRGLKERSGHSYGVLATRLHVSTSTLHRYCHGAAVPTEYAPVERFARVCGANGDELVALHRCWLLADAARRREAGTATPRPRPEPAPAPDPVPVPVVATAPAPRAPGEAARRRLRALLGAVVVIGLIAAASAFVLHGRRGPAALPAATTSGSAATASPTASAPPSAVPSGAASSSAPSTPSPTPPPAASVPAPADDTSAPFHVNVLTDNWGSPCGQWFLSTRSPAQVAAPPDTSADVDSWAAAQQGVPGGHLRLQLTAQGADATPVVLHAAYIQVVSTRPAPKGNAYTPGSGCGGGLTPAAFAVDLDAPAPRATAVPAQESTGKPVLSTFPFRVSATDPQVINVDAATAAQDVSWYLDLVWTSGDRQGRLRVDDHGRPFRTVGIRDAAAYFHDGKRWSPTTPDL
ncbi:helix-turn-helix transcriptional regulator [Kitasatospora sp. NPDC001527]|uniref:helix-turn-helix domain-containing protein n=1 Tax=Kitasatospora sp. NPDC001527 TaxID=3154519 RepID=UPI0033180C44